MFADLGLGELAPLVIIVVAVMYNLGRKLLGMDKKEEQEEEQKAPAPRQKEEAPAKQETKLPYESLVDEMFGPYIQARKRRFEARKNPEPVVRIIRETPDPEPDVMIIEEPAAPAVIEAAPVESVEPSQKVFQSPSQRRKRSLDEIIFRNPRLSPGARLVLASEILNRPLALRDR